MNTQISESAINFIKSTPMKKVKEILAIHDNYKYVVNGGDVFGVSAAMAEEVREVLRLICLVKSYKGTHIEKWTALRTARFMLSHLEGTRDLEIELFKNNHREALLRKAIEVYVKVYH